jgi:hypothetical protein
MARPVAAIPESFKLVNRTWRVKLCDYDRMYQLALDSGYDFDIRGLCDPYDAIIYINKDAHTCHEDMLHTFWHEVGHALLFAQGFFQLRDHYEPSVDKFGALMAQLWNTCEGAQAI